MPSDRIKIIVPSSKIKKLVQINRALILQNKNNTIISCPRWKVREVPAEVVARNF